jgi:hypothetical protein
MMRHPPPPRRGIALLLVLAALLVVVGSLAALAQSAATLRLERKVDAARQHANHLLPAAEGAIMQWLVKHSEKTVLPPDVIQPQVQLLNDELDLNGDTCSIGIVAFDQCGMAPWTELAHGSPLRLGVPTGILQQVDRISLPKSSILGLDLMARNVPEISIFPDWIENSSDFGNAIGGIVATHNEPPRINVNTAPAKMLEQALRVAGRGGLEVILANRAEGKLALAPKPTSAAVRESDANDQPVLQIVSTSTCWSFRVEITVGPATKAWWLIYSHEANQWTCVQRLLIDA